MNQDRMMEYVRTLLGDTDRSQPRFDDPSIRRGLDAAINETNTINPKNPQAHTLESAPETWMACVPEGAAAFCLEERAQQLARSDPEASQQLSALAKSQRSQFKTMAKRVMANRPASR